MRKIYLISIILLINYSLNAQIKISSNFEGGNVEVLHIIDSSQTITIKPYVDKTNTTDVWFYFLVTGYKKNKNINVNIQYSSTVRAPNNPVFSYDKKNWTHTPASLHAKYRKFSFTPSKDSVYIATGYPYLYSDVLKLTRKVKKSKYAQVTTLTNSEKNREIPLFKITNYDISDKSKYLIWIIGRQHAFESLTGYVAEGLCNFLLSDNENAETLRNNAVFYIAPMIDVDNVAIGQSGRMQKPIDINRDWNKKSNWKSVQTLKKIIKETAKKNHYLMFIDLHTPFPGGSYQLFAYFDLYMNNTESENLKIFWSFFEYYAGFQARKLIHTQRKNEEICADQYNTEITYRKNFNLKTHRPDFSTTIECDWNKKPDGGFWYKKDLIELGKNLALTINKYIINKNSIRSK